MDKTCVLSRINALPGPVRWGRHVASQSASRLPHSGKSAKSVFRGCGIQHERRVPRFCCCVVLRFNNKYEGNRAWQQEQLQDGVVCQDGAGSSGVAAGAPGNDTDLRIL